MMRRLVPDGTNLGMKADLAVKGKTSAAVCLELETGELIEKIEDLPEKAKVFVKMQGTGTLAQETLTATIDALAAAQTDAGRAAGLEKTELATQAKQR